MEKIELSNNCKDILYQLHNRTYHLLYRDEDYNDIQYLISKGLINATKMIGRRYSNLQLTEKGELYIYKNPKLENPSIWDDKKYWINTAISIIALIIAIIALFV